MKRIAFLVSDQHLIPHGGIGQFAKGFCEMAEREGHIVDLILDKPPKQKFFDIKGQVYHPEYVSSYSQHQNTFAFSESYNLERALNFRNAFMGALQKNLYDLIVINTPEGLLATYGLGIGDYIPLVFYTHNENLFLRHSGFKGTFNKNYDEFFRQAMKCKGVIVGTQCQLNVDELKPKGWDIRLLPMPMPDREMLTPYTGEKEGILFIGRWEERKDPKEYLRVIEETRLPARVITSPTGVKKFKAELERIGVPHTIKCGIDGAEKAEFIKGSKVLYFPAKSEAFSFTFFEAAGHCHVVLGDYSWSDVWNPQLFHKIQKKDAVDCVKRLYKQDVPEWKLPYVQNMDKGSWDHWKNLIEFHETRKVDSNAANVNKEGDFFYDGYISKLNRFASIEDVISVLGNRHKFKIQYSNDRTWLTKNDLLMPVDDGENTLDAFF